MHRSSARLTTARLPKPMTIDQLQARRCRICCQDTADSSRIHPLLSARLSNALCTFRGIASVFNREHLQTQSARLSSTCAKAFHVLSASVAMFQSFGPHGGPDHSLTQVGWLEAHIMPRQLQSWSSSSAGHSGFETSEGHVCMLS